MVSLTIVIGKVFFKLISIYMISYPLELLSIVPKLNLKGLVLSKSKFLYRLLLFPMSLIIHLINFYLII